MQARKPESEEEKRYYKETLKHLPKPGEDEGGAREDRDIGYFKLKDASGEKPPAEREEGAAEAEPEIIPEEQQGQLEEAKTKKKEVEHAPKQVAEKIGRELRGSAAKEDKKEQEERSQRTEAAPTVRAQAGENIERNGKGGRQRNKKEINRVNAQGEQQGGRVKKRVVEEVKGEIKKSATRKAVEILASAESPVTGALLIADGVKKFFGRNNT